MIDYKSILTAIVKGLREYLNCGVVSANQTAEMPKYPYVTYTVINPKGQNNGTYGEYEDGKARKPFTMTLSITALSDDDIESVSLATKAHEYLDKVGTTYLNDNDVIIQSVSAVTNRDNVISIGYEYKNGFDCVVYCMDVVDGSIVSSGTIDEITINDKTIKGGGVNGE